MQVLSDIPLKKPKYRNKNNIGKANNEPIILPNIAMV
jgi:hypothetical protein